MRGQGGPPTIDQCCGVARSGVCCVQLYMAVGLRSPALTAVMPLPQGVCCMCQAWQGCDCSMEAVLCACVMVGGAGWTPCSLHPCLLGRKPCSCDRLPAMGAAYLRRLAASVTQQSWALLGGRCLLRQGRLTSGTTPAADSCCYRMTQHTHDHACGTACICAGGVGCVFVWMPPCATHQDVDMSCMQPAAIVSWRQHLHCCC